VQGVGFRYHGTFDRRQFAVTGLSKNLPMVAWNSSSKGVRAEIPGDASGRPGPRWAATSRDIYEITCPATGRFFGFDVRF